MSKALSPLLLVAALIVTTAAAADEYVQGYFRRDGTYVQGYWRSDPDGNPYNNYSTYPNVNPYTGQVGTHHVDHDTYSSPYLDQPKPDEPADPYATPSTPADPFGPPPEDDDPQ